MRIYDLTPLQAKIFEAIRGMAACGAEIRMRDIKKLSPGAHYPVRALETMGLIARERVHGRYTRIALLEPGAYIRVSRSGDPFRQKPKNPGSRGYPDYSGENIEPGDRDECGGAFVPGRGLRASRSGDVMGNLS